MADDSKETKIPQPCPIYSIIVHKIIDTKTKVKYSPVLAIGQWRPAY